MDSDDVARSCVDCRRGLTPHRHRRRADRAGRGQPRPAAQRELVRAPVRGRPAAGLQRVTPTGTGSTAAGTGRPTTRCGASCWSGWAPTRGPRSTSNGAPRKGCPSPRSCAASSATSPERSAPRWAETSPQGGRATRAGRRPARAFPCPDPAGTRGSRTGIAGPEGARSVLEARGAGAIQAPASRR